MLRNMSSQTIILFEVKQATVAQHYDLREKRDTPVYSVFPQD